MTKNLLLLKAAILNGEDKAKQLELLDWAESDIWEMESTLLANPFPSLHLMDCNIHSAPARRPDGCTCGANKVLHTRFGMALCRLHSTLDALVQVLLYWRMMKFYPDNKFCSLGLYRQFYKASLGRKKLARDFFDSRHKLLE